MEEWITSPLLAIEDNLATKMEARWYTLSAKFDKRFEALGQGNWEKRMEERMANDTDGEGGGNLKASGELKNGVFAGEISGGLVEMVLIGLWVTIVLYILYTQEWIPPRRLGGMYEIRG